MITIIVTIRCLTLEIKIFQLLIIFQSTKILIINKIIAINVQSSYTKIQNKISLTLSLKNIIFLKKSLITETFATPGSEISSRHPSKQLVLVRDISFHLRRFEIHHHPLLLILLIF